MSRKKVEINQERGKRLRQLLSERNMDQAELANKIGYTKEHISYVINGRRNLTQDMAEAIAKVFPDVRVGWLLDFDKYKSNLDIIKEKGDAVLSCICSIENILRYSASLLGYNVVDTESKSEDGDIIKEYNPNELYWVLTSANFQKVGITLDKYIELRDEVLRYSKFLLEGIVYKANDSWRPLCFTPEDIK